MSEYVCISLSSGGQVDAEASGAVMCVVQNKIDLIDEACMTP